MPKIIDYCVLEFYGHSKISSMVKQYIEFGWQPYGPLITKHNEYVQAMVKYEEVENV